MLKMDQYRTTRRVCVGPGPVARACIAMAYVVVAVCGSRTRGPAYIGMAYVVVAVCGPKTRGPGLNTYGLCSYGLVWAQDL